MKYLDVEGMYNDYKNNINIYKLFYSNKSWIIKFLFGVYILTAALLGLTTILLLIKFNKLVLILFIISILIFLSCIVSAIIVERKVNIIIKKKYNFSSIEKNIYYHLILKEEFIKYLDNKEIRTKKQKESLVELLKQKSQKYKRDKLWFPGIIAALYIPIWNNLISKVMNIDSKNVIQSILTNVVLFGGIALGIIVVICFIRYTINDSILITLNTRSARYEMMAYMIQEDLILNYYNKDEKIFNGELTIIKK